MIEVLLFFIKNAKNRQNIQIFFKIHFILYV